MPEWEIVRCAKCGLIAECTPWHDYYTTRLWDGEGRVGESCFLGLIRAHMAGGDHA